MNDHRPELTDGEIRELLAATPDPEPSAEQLERIAARIGLDRAAAGPTMADPKDRASTGLAPANSTSADQWGRGRWLSSAAVLVLVVAAVVALVAREPDGSMAPASNPERGSVTGEAVEIEPPGQVFCRVHVAELEGAVGTWNGVENWAFLSDRRLPEPDLVTIALDALQALELLAPSDEVASAASALADLRSDDSLGPDADEPVGWTRTERTAHEEAVERARELIAAAIATEEWSGFDGCDV